MGKNPVLPIPAGAASSGRTFAIAQEMADHRRTRHVPRPDKAGRASEPKDHSARKAAYQALPGASGPRSSTTPGWQTAGHQDRRVVPFWVGLAPAQGHLRRRSLLARPVHIRDKAPAGLARQSSSGHCRRRSRCNTGRTRGAAARDRPRITNAVAPPVRQHLKHAGYGPCAAMGAFHAHPVCDGRSNKRHAVSADCVLLRMSGLGTERGRGCDAGCQIIARSPAAGTWPDGKPRAQIAQAHAWPGRNGPQPYSASAASAASTVSVVSSSFSTPLIHNASRTSPLSPVTIWRIPCWARA